MINDSPRLKTNDQFAIYQVYINIEEGMRSFKPLLKKLPTTSREYLPGMFFYFYFYFCVCACVCVCVFIKLHINNRAIRPCHPSHSMPLALILPSVCVCTMTIINRVLGDLISCCCCCCFVSINEFILCHTSHSTKIVSNKT